MQPRPWLKPALKGVVIGGIGVPLAGLVYGILVFGGTAESRANQRAALAVTEALVPICVSQSQADPATVAKLAEFKALSTYQRGDFVAKAGWATMPGGDAKPRSDLARACAVVLSKTVDV